jgi:hypothetical protein
LNTRNGQKDGDFTDAKTLATTSNSTQVAILVKDLNQTAIELEQSQAYQLCLM